MYQLFVTELSDCPPFVPPSRSSVSKTYFSLFSTEILLSFFHPRLTEVSIVEARNFPPRIRRLDRDTAVLARAVFAEAYPELTDPFVLFPLSLLDRVRRLNLIMSALSKCGRLTQMKEL